MLEELAGLPAQRRRQWPGPVEAEIVRVADGRAWFTVKETGDVVYGPAPYPTNPGVTQAGGDGHTHDIAAGGPPVGARCLVVFAGPGSGRPWVVAVDGWPA